jgi:hypothetical protein
MTFQVRRNTADGILDEVALGGAIKMETLQELLKLLGEKTDYLFHIAVEIHTPMMLKTIDNEGDALDTISRLRAAPAKSIKPAPKKSSRKK